MYKKIILTVLFAFTNDKTDGFRNMPLAKNTIIQEALCRRQFLGFLTKGTLIYPLIVQDVKAQDRPLTDEEMKEYNKLLEEAKRIKNIIDANVNASKKLLLTDEENDLEKYIRENHIK